MRIGWFIPLPGPLNVGGIIWRSKRGRRPARNATVQRRVGSNRNPQQVEQRQPTVQEHIAANQERWLHDPENVLNRQAGPNHLAGWKAQVAARKAAEQAQQ
jgi:hypothetical protein